MDPKLLEEAVLCSYSPAVAEETKRRALAFLGEISNSPEGWRMCLERLFYTENIHVKFFCLQVCRETILHRYAALSDSDREGFKKALMSWLKDHLSTKPEEISIKNVFAQVLVLLFKAEYPEHWPTFFSDLLGLLSLGPVMVDMFLRIMKTIDEEVVNQDVHRSPAELAHNVAIKDHMRATALRQISDTWYAILQTFEHSHPDLVHMCLANVRAYISWIDIGLVVNERFIPLLFRLLSSEPFREEACECVVEIVDKGMDPLDKLRLLSELKLVDVVQSLGPAINNNANTNNNNAATPNLPHGSDIGFRAAVARLVNAMGLACLAGLEKLEATMPALAPQGHALLERTLALSYSLYSHPANRVSAATTEFISAYLARLKKTQGGLGPAQQEHLRALLAIVATKMRLPTNYDFDDADSDSEKEFAEYRAELAKHFKTVARLAPDLAAQFVHGSLAQLLSNMHAFPYQELEVALTLFYLMSEALPAESAAQPKAVADFLASVTAGLVDANVFAHPHPVIAVAAFETVVRYARYLPTNPPKYILAVISALVDTRGLRHRHVKVRSKAAYLLARLVRTLRPQLAPVADELLRQLKDFIAITPELARALPFDKHLFVFETAGLLIAPASSPEQQHAYMEQLVGPLLVQIEDILARKLYATDPPENPVYTTLLGQLIAALGTLSVGCSVTTADVTTRAYFKKALNLLVNDSAVLKGYLDLPARMVQFLHRMVEALDEEIFPFLAAGLAPLLPAVSHGNYRNVTKDTQEYVKLVHRLCSRFKEPFLPILDPLFPELLRCIFVCLQAPTSPQSEEERERNELLKLYYNFLYIVLSSNLAAVLTSPLNASLLPTLMESLVHGLQLSDYTVQKTTLAILGKMVQLWLQPNPPKDPQLASSFANLLFSSILPMCLQTPLRPDFDLNDAVANNVLTEIVRLQSYLAASGMGTQLAEYLDKKLLPDIGCPPAAREAYMQQLAKNNLNEFKAFLRGLMLNLKGAPLQPRR